MRGTEVESIFDVEKVVLLRLVSRAAARFERRCEAIRRDLARIDEAAGWADRASWLVPAAARAPRGATALKVADWSTGEERTIELPLDPSKPARAQVEAVFHEARRLRKGRPIAEQRLADADRAATALRAIVPDVEAAATRADLDAIRARATAIAPRELAPARSREDSAKAQAQGPKPPFRTYVGAGGVRVLVGRGAKDNDELTWRVARPHHYWLHAKGYPGAHVIAWNAKGAPLSPDLLVDAAHLAAHFSDARGEAFVEVTYAERRYLRKPRGSPPGLVVVDREKVIPLRVDPARLAALLASARDELTAPPLRAPRAAPKAKPRAAPSSDAATPGGAPGDGAARDAREERGATGAGDAGDGGAGGTGDLGDATGPGDAGTAVRPPPKTPG